MVEVAVAVFTTQMVEQVVLALEEMVLVLLLFRELQTLAAAVAAVDIQILAILKVLLVVLVL